MEIKWHLKSFDQLTTRLLWKIYYLRDKVFVVEQKSPFLDADPNDLKSYHLYAMDEHRNIIAYSRFFKTPNYVSFGRIVVPKSMRGKGLGKELIKRVMKAIREKYGLVTIMIEAEYYAVGFYKHFGFKTLGKPLIDAGVKHIVMMKYK